MPQDHVECIGKIAQAIITAKRVCILGTAEKQITVPAAANGVPYGVVQGQEGEAFAIGDFLDIAISGCVEVEAGTGGISKGSWVYIVDVAGKVANIPAPDGSARNLNVLGICEKAATDGNIGEVRICKCVNYLPAA